MPLLGNGEYREPLSLDEHLEGWKDSGPRTIPTRKQSQHSVTARIAMNNFSTPNPDDARTPEGGHLVKKEADYKPPRSHSGEGNLAAPPNMTKGALSNGAALTDTPSTTASNSPTM